MTKRKIMPIHPGEHLAEFLDEYGLSQYRLAKDIHVPARRVNEIIHCRRGISVDTAMRLGRYFKMTAQFWINLQSVYELEVAEIEKGQAIAEEVSPLKVA